MDRSTSEKQFVPDLFQMTDVISVSPTVSATCTPSYAADFFFFSFNFGGRRRSKKKCSPSIKVHGWGKLISRVLSLFSTGSDRNHSAVYLLHLGSHRLDTAQNLILVCDSGDPNSCQVTVDRGRRKREKESYEGWEPLFRASCRHTFESATINTAQQGRCIKMFN